MDKPLLPALRSALPDQPGQAFDVSLGLQPFDKLHVLNEAIAGHLAGSVLPVLGHCLSRETPTSQPYALVAYVAVSPTVCIPYAERSAAHFEVDQHIERWFGSIQLYLAEIDITDHADNLALERLTAAAPAAAPAPKPTRMLYIFTWPDEDQQHVA
jgi:hypothetical protein